MNTYIQSMKNVLNNFYNAAKTYNDKVAQAGERYKPDVAAEEVKKIDAQLEADKRAAIDAITEAKDKGIEAAKRWGALDGDKINDGDMKLLKFDLSPEQFEAIVDRNRNNGTMCFILKQYAEKHAKHEMKDDEANIWKAIASNALSVVDVPTVDEKIKAYNTFAENAIGIIQNMTGYGWGRGVDGFGVESSVKGFGEPNQMNYKLLEVLGG